MVTIKWDAVYNMSPQVKCWYHKLSMIPRPTLEPVIKLLNNEICWLQGPATNIYLTFWDNKGSLAAGLSQLKTGLNRLVFVEKPAGIKIETGC